MAPGPNAATAPGGQVRPIRAAFVVEQHLGHRTYAQNLEAAASRIADVDARFIPVDYQATGGFSERVPMPAPLRAVLRARREIARGLSADNYEVRVFNTQVPAVIGSRIARAKPYILITDVTPVQYDQMPEGYGHSPDRPGPTRWLKHSWNRHVFRAAAYTVAWSSWARSSIVDDYDADPERAFVVPPGVDTGLWSPTPEPQHGPMRILFVGGDFVRKGGNELLRAYSTLPSGSAELVIVTKSTLPRRDDVRIVSDVVPNDARLIELYRASDVFVLPSRSETFGIAAVEASASGLPVIAADVGGLTDIVAHDETGFMFQPGDDSALGSYLRLLQEQPQLRRRMGDAARARAVERFDARTNAERLFEIVRRCVAH